MWVGRVAEETVASDGGTGEVLAACQEAWRGGVHRTLLGLKPWHLDSHVIQLLSFSGAILTSEGSCQEEASSLA